MDRERTVEHDNHVPSAPPTPWLEWLAAGVGLLLTLGVFGSIGWQALENVSAPPVISVQIEKIVVVEGGYRVEFRAQNTAGSTAAQVEIEGRLAGEGFEAETSRVLFDYVPGHSARQGGMFFTRDPRITPLSLRATGYATP